MLGSSIKVSTTPAVRLICPFRQPRPCLGFARRTGEPGGHGAQQPTAPATRASRGPRSLVSAPPSPLAPSSIRRPGLARFAMPRDRRKNRHTRVCPNWPPSAALEMGVTSRSGMALLKRKAIAKAAYLIACPSPAAIISPATAGWRRRYRGTDMELRPLPAVGRGTSRPGYPTSDDERSRGPQPRHATPSLTLFGDRYGY